ncbi:hypothetical protein PVK64_01940 [Aliivibrio sp. S4TY2]|uniref:hypothetical protein n=1 Tax=unclassified Aliivibrio TaxID=2645654 RepID=UPI00237A0478|nr:MULTISPECIES: hypothetical protein [unclassified Aliivibrio]MDD9154953.1 hypothetical protein [Aliivibrio sp. S4TY2]MDD9158684.1 hypothetical protein [Aliivibrio sp. S4TY1]MDD9162956.1 hypothetical protein [Aliivibrio sp. S4MY2]MDD9166683.1 hypothetical protein [Aliivibrio sp. S4MY4]MDD9184033.1 hypothetical protein [Aliivibrio sp. S4MY3]
MPEKDIARIDVTMSNLVELTREQNTTLKKVLEMLTETRTKQESHSERIGKLESDKTWLVRLILAALITAIVAAVKAL